MTEGEKVTPSEGRSPGLGPWDHEVYAGGLTREAASRTPSSWLTNGWRAVTTLAEPYPSEPMTRWPISTRVNKPENETALYWTRWLSPWIGKLRWRSPLKANQRATSGPAKPLKAL